MSKEKETLMVAIVLFLYRVRSHCSDVMQQSSNIRLQLHRATHSSLTVEIDTLTTTEKYQLESNQSQFSMHLYRCLSSPLQKY